MARDSKVVFDAGVERRIEQVAAVDADVLVTGPTGSGKSAAARRIHQLSARRAGPFVAQNCGAIPGELAESTLFGHERGAFTTAEKAAPGIVATADGGTLFLDEIGELSLAIQVKLLTLLQDRVYRRLGSVEERRATFRLVAATNRDLLELCNQGLFREDLYHRINGLSLTLPPLRDTPEQARRIAAEEVQRLKMPEALGAQVVSAVGSLCRHPAAWPGNVRELLTFVRRCVLGVEAEELRILGEWARWRRSEGAGRLTAFAPSVSPSLADRERYAGRLHELAGRGARPKTAVSREVSLALASRLLDAFPEPLSLDEVQAVLGARDRRTLTTNVDLLVTHGLVQRSPGGIVASWPPATSTVFALHQGEWIPAGPGVILPLVHGDRVRIEVTSKRAGTLGIMLVTHGTESAPAPVVIVEGKELFASRVTTLEIELDGKGGLEQILLHVGPPAGRGGRLVEPTSPEGIMPDSTALELGRRMVLERWQEGWLAEHLVFHSQGG
jgi:Sigma-54 interaction domain